MSEVPGALALGAVLPDGKPFSYTLNYRPAATGWIIHMSGGGVISDMYSS